MNPLLTAAVEEERRLVARLEAVRALICAYGGAPAQAPLVSQTARHGIVRTISRGPSPQTQRIKAVVRELLDGQETPTPTRDIAAYLESEGIAINGKDKIASLSALLSHSGEFESIGRNGWIMKRKGSDEATPDPACNGGGSTPLFESQKEEAPTG